MNSVADLAFARRTREFLGVLLREVVPYSRALSGTGSEYLSICNRNERLLADPDGTGYKCDWQWTSDLHAPKYFPHLGIQLFKRALRDHPIRCADSPHSIAEPRVAFLIGHRGDARLPHLLKTIGSIAAQVAVPIECVVVEQDMKSKLTNVLPPWVKVVHTPPPVADMPYCRSWAFNVGRRHVTAPILVLHDNDMMVPVDYASQIVQRVARGYEVVNLKRFIFYCTEDHTNAIFDGSAGLDAVAPGAIVQNLEGGGSVAITSAAFDQIGGMDESFVGWGGEDNEFWERAQTRNVSPYASLPIIHLWHVAQAGKQDANNSAPRRYQSLTKLAPEDRVLRLGQITRGAATGPSGYSAKPARIPCAE